MDGMTHIYMCSSPKYLEKKKEKIKLPHENVSTHLKLKIRNTDKNSVLL